MLGGRGGKNSSGGGYDPRSFVPSRPRPVHSPNTHYRQRSDLRRMSSLALSASRFRRRRRHRPPGPGLARPPLVVKLRAAVGVGRGESLTYRASALGLPKRRPPLGEHLPIQGSE